MGRKPGSLNRKTMMMLPMLEALSYRDPAQVLAEIASMPEARLRKLTATEAGRSAMAARLKAAAELMPYCHGKLPVSVNVTPILPVLEIVTGTNQIEQFQQDASVVAEHVGWRDVGRVHDLFENVQQFEEKADD